MRAPSEPFHSLAQNIRALQGDDMSERTIPYSLDQIGTTAVRFPSGIPVPTQSDAGVDPYVHTRISKHVHVEAVMFWPQVKETFPGLVLLHEWWGLNSEIKDQANRLACEGYVVLMPNLYVRLGGMVTASADLAQTLMGRLNEKDALQDINSCCEFLNTRDHVQRNVHGVVGFGMGGPLAIQFAGQRRRLRAAVAFYGQVPAPADGLKDLCCPLQYHRAGLDDVVTADDLERLTDTGQRSGKKVDIRVYENARPSFCNETRKEAYHPQAAQQAFETMVEFLGSCFEGAPASPFPIQGVPFH